MRFLIIKTSALGDIVQTYPVVHYLKNRFPGCLIDWVVEKRAQSLVQDHPQIDNAIVIDAKSWKKKLFSIATYRELFAFLKDLRKDSYDVVFDLQGNSKSAFITFFSKSRCKVGFGWKTVHERPNLLVTTHKVNPPVGQNIRRDYLYVVQDYFHDHLCSPDEDVSLKLKNSDESQLELLSQSLPENTWLICPGSQWQNKKISDDALQGFLELSGTNYAPHFIFLSGSDEEKVLSQKMAKVFCENSQILHKPSFVLLQHVMKKVKLVISVDSLPLHLAGTTETPTFSIFGPSIANKFRPLKESSYTYQASCPFNKTFEKRCPELRSCSTGACLKNIQPQELFYSFQRWYDHKKELQSSFLTG